MRLAGGSEIANRQALLRSLVSVVAATVFALLVAEALLRLVAPQWSDQWKMWRNHPVYTRGLRQNVDNELVHGHSGEFAFRFSTNELGLRMDGGFSKLADPGVRRILMVGDSFTFGYGVDQGEAFANQLVKLANREGKPAEVINAGFASGYTFDTEYLFTREVGAEWRPADVIVGVCLSNDIDDMKQNIWTAENGKLVSIKKDNDWVPVWVKKSGLINLAVKGSWPAIRSFGRPRRKQTADTELTGPCESPLPLDLSSRGGLPPQVPPPFPEEEIGTWSIERRIKSVMQAWSYHAEKYDYRLTLLLIPDAREIQRDSYPARRAIAGNARSIFVEAARDAGVRVIDPARPMRDHVCSGGEPLYFNYDGHWNAAGHAFVGQLLMDELFGNDR